MPGGKLTKTQVRALVETLQDIVTLLAEADETDRNELYQELGISLTHHPEGRVQVEALPRGVMVRVGGAFLTRSTRDQSAWEAWLEAA